MEAKGFNAQSGHIVDASIVEVPRQRNSREDNEKIKQSHYPEGSNQDRENRRRSKIRKRVEHVFGFMENSMGGKFIRSIGLDRAKHNIGLMNWVYNLCRYEQLCRIGTS